MRREDATPPSQLSPAARVAAASHGALPHRFDDPLTQSSTDHASYYWRALLDVAPRLLSLLDREERSPTRGSFDRVHWAWKFRDFPLNMWQASLMPLAILYRERHAASPYFGSAPLARWIAAGLDATLRRQHRNGAFDTVAPYSQDHGVTLAMVLTIATTVETMGDAVPGDLRRRSVDALSRACRFAQRSEEDYAYISNHQAAFALAYLRAARLTGDDSLLRLADDKVADVLRHQSPDGWFEEYGGPDPGYETFALTYLALFNRERPTASLGEALRRSADFLAHCVHPDGSIGGNYGSRNTGQYAPGGLTILSGSVPSARAIVDFMALQLGDDHAGNTITPARCDDDNLPLLTYSYAVAATCPLAPLTDVGPASPLPCHLSDVSTTFDDSRVVVAATPRYYAVANLAKGGVMRIFQRRRGVLRYEDGGYLLAADDGEWASSFQGQSAATVADAARTVTCQGTFAQLKRESLTPAKFLVLRALNLTAFRSVRLGALVRRMIIARLITGRRGGPWVLKRSIFFGEDRIVIEDVIEPREGVRVTRATLERSLLPMHMGSAKYFHANELVDFSLPSLDGWSERLSAGQSVTLRQEIRFDDEALDEAASAATRLSVRTTDLSQEMISLERDPA